MIHCLTNGEQIVTSEYRIDMSIFLWGATALLPFKLRQLGHLICSLIDVSTQ